MTRPVVRVPDKLDGEPHIEGTTLTIAEIQSYWRQPGVGALEIRARYPQLSEAELGAAVIYVEPVQPQFSFSAETDGGRRKLHIFGQPSDWSFVCEEVQPDGEIVPVSDSWEESFTAIVRYIPDDTPPDIVWRDDRSDKIVDLVLLNLMED